MTYEDGFDQGERDAFADRKAGIPLTRECLPHRSLYHRGYAEGYAPRSPAWWAGLPMTTGEPQKATA